MEKSRLLKADYQITTWSCFFNCSPLFCERVCTVDNSNYSMGLFADFARSNITSSLCTPSYMPCSASTAEELSYVTTHFLGSILHYCEMLVAFMWLTLG